MSVPKNEEFFKRLNGYRPNHRDLTVNKTFAPDPHIAALVPQSSNPLSPSLKTQSPKLNSPALDPVKILLIQLQLEKTGMGKANRVNEALHNAKDDAVMSVRIRDASLGATHGSDRAEIMGTMMKISPSFLMEADHNSLSLNGADLSGATQQALKALPYNQMDIRGATFPPNLDLTNNPFMGAGGVNLDGVSMPRVNLPANMHVLSAKNAQIDQSSANPTSAMLSFAGADTGHKATWDFAPHAMVAFEAAPTNTSKMTPEGKPLQDAKSLPFAGLIDAPSPFAI